MVARETEKKGPFEWDGRSERVEGMVDTTLTEAGERAEGVDEVVDTTLTGKPVHEIVMLEMLSMTLEKKIRRYINKSWRQCESEIDHASEITRKSGWFLSYNKKWFLELATPGCWLVDEHIQTCSRGLIQLQKTYLYFM